MSKVTNVSILRNGVRMPVIPAYNSDIASANNTHNVVIYDVATKTECAGKRALIMGKLYKHNGEWKFAALGDAFEDRSIIHTIARVTKDYSR